MTVYGQVEATANVDATAEGPNPVLVPMLAIGGMIGVGILIYFLTKKR